MGLFDQHEPQNPYQTATDQYGMNRAAARDTRRFTDVNQQTPWGQVRFTGTPGEMSYTRHVTLDPYDQMALDDYRFNRNALSGLISDYLMPQVEQSAGMRFDYGALPQIPAFQNFATGGGQAMQGLMPQGMSGGATGPAGGGSFIQGPTPAMQDYRQQMQDYRANRLAGLMGQSEAAANPQLPQTIPLQELHNYFGEFNPDKQHDVQRWLGAHGMAGQQEFDIDDLIGAASQGFPGASERSINLLHGLVPYLQQWQGENTTPAAMPAQAAPTARPQRPSLRDLLGVF